MGNISSCLKAEDGVNASWNSYIHLCTGNLVKTSPAMSGKGISKFRKT